MPEPTSEVLLLSAGFACALAGMAWLALTMEEHWQRASGRAPLGRAGVLAQRTLAAAALGASLGMALLADHPTMAALVWIMELGASALGVALALAWRPRALRLFVPWAWR